MSMTFEVLGTPGRDNALLVRIDSGQSLDRLLFDCGDGCLNEIGYAEIKEIDHVFFSHLHMDHVGGFDYFFRSVFNRENKPNQIWGPPDSRAILQHRFQGFLWNLHAEMKGVWRVTDIHPEETLTSRYELKDAFAIAHDEAKQPRTRFLIETNEYTVEALTMNHRTPTLAYVVREKTRQNIDMNSVARLGLRPGPWMKIVKDPANGAESIAINGVSHSVASLREALVVETPGDSIAYLTDFLLDEESIERLSTMLKGCKTVVCEGQYRHCDLDLAKKNFHMTTVLSAQLAHRANIGELILFHLSDRYKQEEWHQMLLEARTHFPATSYPASWKIGSV